MIPKVSTHRVLAALRLRWLLAGLFVCAVAVAVWQVHRTQPAPSALLQKWMLQDGPKSDRGAALLAFANFGALDLDTLETAALPWPFMAAALALQECGGDPQKVDQSAVQAAFKRFGLFFPKSIANHADLKPSKNTPFGISIGVIERAVPPLRITAMTLGCSACHAGPAYRSDGSPDPDVVVLGRPNPSIDLEAFSTNGYKAIKSALENEPAFLNAMQRLFPDMSLRERLTLEWIALPELRERMTELSATIDKPLPFRNGAPGLTNGVAALKLQLGLISPKHFINGAGFVSIPDLADRSFRSALLVDSAYVAEGRARYRPIAHDEVAKRDARELAAIASFFMVPTMGMTSDRTAAAIPDLTDVIKYLARTRPEKFPGSTDLVQAEAGRRVYARACAQCHGDYNDDLDRPQLVRFPNWAGDVGTDLSRAKAFDERLKKAVDKTAHGKRFIDAAATGVISAPLLSGLWSSAPYLTNGTIPTVRHLLEPETRPASFLVGGHKIDTDRIGIALVPSADGAWTYPAGYQPYSQPVIIDTRKPGYFNRGHEKEVSGLTPDERTQLIEYLKLL